MCFSLSSQTKPEECLWFLGSDGSREFVFNLGLSKEHAGFSPKIGSSTESGEGWEKEEKKKERRRGGDFGNEHQMPYLRW